MDSLSKKILKELEAMQQTGWIPPTDVNAVAETEEWLSEAGLPFPAELLQRGDSLMPDAPDASVPVRIRLWQSASMDATLARAAREGGTLSLEVEKTMRRDREAAEAQIEPQNGDASDDDE